MLDYSCTTFFNQSSLLTGFMSRSISKACAWSARSVLAGSDDRPAACEPAVPSMPSRSLPACTCVRITVSAMTAVPCLGTSWDGHDCQATTCQAITTHLRMLQWHPPPCMQGDARELARLQWTPSCLPPGAALPATFRPMAELRHAVWRCMRHLEVPRLRWLMRAAFRLQPLGLQMEQDAIRRQLGNR